MAAIFAHSRAGRPLGDWETLHAHAAAVGGRCSQNAAPFGFAMLCRAAGRLHDIGKCSSSFQSYLRQEAQSARGPDHSTAGAIEAAKLFPGFAGRALAFIIAGHHAGLADGVHLGDRLGKAIEPYPGWMEHVGPLPPVTGLRPTQKMRPALHPGFSQAFLIRVLFSCLVDADSIETERFMQGGSIERDGFTGLPILLRRLDGFMAAVRAKAPPTPLNALRAETLAHALAQAQVSPGLFTMTVPTGGGKTLASLSFALAHAVRHELRRVVYVIPFAGARIETWHLPGVRVTETVAPSRGRGSKRARPPFRP